jgi:hypothetical protein
VSASIIARLTLYEMNMVAWIIKGHGTNSLLAGTPAFCLMFSSSLAVILIECTGMSRNFTSTIKGEEICFRFAFVCLFCIEAVYIIIVRM